MRSLIVPRNITNVIQFNGYSDEARAVYIHYNYLFLNNNHPEVSIIVPTYNNGNSILKTLHSICLNKTKRIFEIIVVDNNSEDNTEKLVKVTGIKYINETVQGTTAVRNAGLGAATGKFVLFANAKAIYSKYWIEELTKPLDNDKNICMTYGRFSFLPSVGTSKIKCLFYEYLEDTSRFFNAKFKDETKNLYGFNFGFRKEQALTVDWFNHPKEEHEDRWLAKKFRDRKMGRLYCVTSLGAIAWVSDKYIRKHVSLSISRIKNINKT